MHGKCCVACMWGSCGVATWHGCRQLYDQFDQYQILRECLSIIDRRLLGTMIIHDECHHLSDKTSSWELQSLDKTVSGNAWVIEKKIDLNSPLLEDTLSHDSDMEDEQ